MMKDKLYGILFSKPSTPFFTLSTGIIIIILMNNYELKIMIRCVEIYKSSQTVSKQCYKCNFHLLYYFIVCAILITSN